MNWHLKNIRLYPKNESKSLDMGLFKNPTAEYRGTPFWSWNAKLDRDTLFQQIEAFREMGLGGFHMHARTGLGTAYLSDEFMERVRDCIHKARDLKMIAWLYDEDRWPSGAAGGLVTKDHSLRARHLLWTATPYSGKSVAQDGDSAARGSRRENGRLLVSYEVKLDGDGRLASYRRLKEGQKAGKGATTWYAYLEVAGESTWFNNQSYVDTLNPKAIEKFVQITHERYKEKAGEYFGSLVPSIFTDEPQFTHKGHFDRADELRDIVMPFTDDFFETYAEAYGQRLEDFLPEIFWELPEGQVSLARYRYHDHVAERFAAAFADTCGKWCIENGIALTGHVMAEENLETQTRALGEAMRSYRGFQLPGIDILLDKYEYGTAKQAQSAAHQYGRPGVLSELYGVTKWEFDFLGHKAQGDWQAALGITVRVPHLAWVSMAGEAKRDYPGAIDYHAPWYKEYPLVENHFARVNVAMTRGKPVIRVGVIHPVESYWLAFGPLQHTKLRREELERAFENVTKWLLFGMQDFNYISESLLPELNAKQSDKTLEVGQMAYDVVIVPTMTTIRSSTLERLEKFAKAGGKLIFAGEVPTLVDAKPSKRPAQLAKRAQKIDLSRSLLMDALEEVREVDVRTADGGRADTVLYQLRKDGKNRHLFIAQTHRRNNFPDCRVRIRGKWQVTQLDTFTGTASPIAHTQANGWTIVTTDLIAHGHLLLTLTPGKAASVQPQPRRVLKEIGRLADPVPVTLSEPNVLLLDQAQWRVGENGEWQKRDELLRIDNHVRQILKLEEHGGHIAQPWTDTAEDPIAGTVQLRFTFDSDVAVKGAELALEGRQFAKVTLDGREANMEQTGWFVDESIQRVRLPDFAAGGHELIVSYAFARKRNIEWMYLLGDFGLRVSGRIARIIGPVRQLAFGDYVTQGLPFYAGNVTYHCTIEGDGSETTLAAPYFSCPLLSVDLDGKPAGKIAFEPFQVNLGKLARGTHQLDITAFGNRANAFGPLHNCDPQYSWWGPFSWRTEGRAWSDEYQLKRMGILVAPAILGM